jgi:capsid protein
MTTLTAVNGHRGARQDRLFADWSRDEKDPDGVWAADASPLGARSEDGSRNNALHAALRSTWIRGVVGAHGRRWQSLYQADSEHDTSTEESGLRRQLMDLIAIGTDGTQADAQGLRTWRDLQAAALASEMDRGDAFALRVVRPRADGLWTRIRVIHAARVETPPGRGPDTNIVNGIELGRDGDPVALWIRRSHPGQILLAARSAGDDYVRVPMRDARGMPTVTWSANRQQPEVMRGTGWIAPVASLLRQLDGTLEAHVAAKRMQACIGLIYAVPDPARAAAADRNGEVLTAHTQFRPGKVYYTKVGSTITPLNFNYQGQDFDAFHRLMAQAISAAFGPGLPSQFVEQQLTRSNMASSRTALLQAWLSFQFQGASLEDNHLRTWISWMIDEAISRQLIRLPTGPDLRRACHGKWRGPARLSPDPLREWQAGEHAVGLGAAPSTILDDHDLTYGDELRQGAEDRRLAAEQGHTIGPYGTTEPVEDPLPPTPTKDDEEDT